MVDYSKLYYNYFVITQAHIVATFYDRNNQIPIRAKINSESERHNLCPFINLAFQFFI